MKRHRNLYPLIISFDNLLLAARKAQKGKRYHTNVCHFNVHLEKELLKLHAELKNKTYRPGAYTEFNIYEPKKRMISAAPYRDRVVHHALCNIIEPIFERTFIFDSYANRKGKGTHEAIKRYQHFAQQYKYVVKSDIRKYFPSIVHQILKNEIAKKIKCADTLWLIHLIIDHSNAQEMVNHVFEGDNLFTNTELRKGLPMGNLTSQFFANVYLNAFDHFVNEQLKCSAYIRYVDDFVLFANNKSTCHDYIRAVKLFLAQYRLKVHENKTQITQTPSGLDFLGHRVFRRFRLLRKENLKRFRRRIQKRYNLLKQKRISQPYFVNGLISWLGHAKFSNTRRIRYKIICTFADVLWYEPFFKGVVFRTKE